MHEGPRHRTGGRAGRMAARLAAHVESAPFLTRALKPFEVLDEEGLALLEQNADTILEEVGIEFRGDPAALDLLRNAGADITGELVRFPRGMCRSIVQASAPRVFTQHARNPERTVKIGDPYTVLAPNYGSPFVRDLDNGRRYGTIEDFRNFVKLTYMSPNLHHSGGTVCEPVDVPVNKRHLDMVYSHIRYSDKPFMGSVTHPSRAADTVELAKIAFSDLGADYLDDHTVVLSLINANSPLVWDSTMLGAARVYAAANQATLITPFILAGAMSPVTVAATAAQTLAEALAGMTFVQLTRPGAPVVLGSFASSISMQSGAPTFGTPEPALVLYVMAALARRLGVPFRSGGNLCASKVADAQAAYESAATFQPTILAGAMSPVTVAATAAQTLAEALAGMTFVQLTRPGAPVVLGSFASSISMQSGAPTFGTPEPALVLYVMAALARRLGVPFRSGGNLCASKVADAQAAYESAATFQPTILAGVNFVLHAAGWLEGGLAIGYEKFILDNDQCGMAAVFVNGVDLSENGQALDAIRENGPGLHFLGNSHTLANFETAFYRSEIADNNSFEQWLEDGGLDAAQRANAIWKKQLAEYEAPPLDASIDEALLDFIARTKASMPDSEV